MLKKFCLIGLSSVFLINQAIAMTIDENHPVKASIPVHASSSNKNFNSSVKQIRLMNVVLSKNEQDIIAKKKMNSVKAIHDAELPPSVDVGMNGVPVLDQGPHGSCVTFANTAAVDALLGKGDYVSQLCNLELGRYLKLRSDFPSGWNGSYGNIVLDQMLRFGIVSKETQHTKSCAGITEYPMTDEEDNGVPLALDDFNAMRETLVGQGLWRKSLSDISDYFNNTKDNTKDGNQVLLEVKKYLANDTDKSVMITFGAFILDGGCGWISCGKYHEKQDAWVVTDYMKEHTTIFGGHEMVITGYDDNAVAIDNKGKEHKGLLKLRNSWGADAGDHGDYYMSYDYFTQYANEVNVITQNHLQ